MTLRDMLIIDEGSVKKDGLHIPYPDSLGFLTIGYGHLIKDHEKAVPITEEEACALLDKDIEEHVHEVLKRWPWVSRLDEDRRNVVFNMAFNLGVYKLRRFKKFLAHMENRRWKEARGEMLNSLWARQVKSRATRLADIVWKETV